MSPMCWLIQASRPEARQKVFFSSPPMARTRRRLERQANRERGVAPGTSDRQLLALVDPHDGVVAGHVDGSVVDEPGISEGAQALPGVGVVVADRLVAQVAAGHDERRRRRGIGSGHRLEQQVVQQVCRAAAAPTSGLPGATSWDSGPPALRR